MDDDREHHDFTLAVGIILVLAVVGIARQVTSWGAARQDQRILDAAVRRSQAWDRYAAQRHAAVNRFLQRAARP
jgi:hypothetical protein